MDAELVIAGVGCAALALGHATIGLRWVLPALAKGCLPGTPVGPPPATGRSATFRRITTLLLH